MADHPLTRACMCVCEREKGGGERNLLDTLWIISSYFQQSGSNLFLNRATKWSLKGHLAFNSPCLLGRRPFRRMNQFSAAQGAQTCHQGSGLCSRRQGSIYPLLLALLVLPKQPRLLPCPSGWIPFFRKSDWTLLLEELLLLSGITPQHYTCLLRSKPLYFQCSLLQGKQVGP